jgi:hypothetical protein
MMLYKDYNLKVFSWGGKITGHESQGACRQDELIGGKPPVVKWLWLLIDSVVIESEENSEVSHRDSFLIKWEVMRDYLFVIRRRDWFVNQNQVSHNRREATRSPVRSGASFRQSLIVS